MLGPYPCTICSVPEFHLKCNCNSLWHPMANIFSCQALWHQVTCIHTAPSQAGSLADICAFCCLAPDEPISWSPHCHKACLLSQSHQQVTPSDSVFPSHIRAPQCHLALNVWAPWRVLEASPRSCHPKLLALSKPACLMHMYDGTETAFQSVASSLHCCLCASQPAVRDRNLWELRDSKYLFLGTPWHLLVFKRV